MDKKLPNKEELLEKKTAAERAQDPELEAKEAAELKVPASKEEADKIRQEIEKMDLDDHLKAQAQSVADDARYLDDEEKVKKLLEVAKAKDVVVAVHAAKKMDNSYVLDKLHDAMVEQRLYKK